MERVRRERVKWYNLDLNRRSENKADDFWGDSSGRLLMSAPGKLDIDDLAWGLMERIPFRFKGMERGQSRYVSVCEVDGQIRVSVRLTGRFERLSEEGPCTFKCKIAEMLIRGGPDHLSGLYAMERGAELTFSHAYYSKDAGMRISRSATETSKKYLKERSGMSVRLRVVFPFRAMFDNSWGFLLYKVDHGRCRVHTGESWRPLPAAGNGRLAG